MLYKGKAVHSFKQAKQVEMAETYEGVKMSSCNDTCGCTVPCPGDATCRCTSKTEASGGDGHMKCSCGDHCGCNPCTCTKSVVSIGVGKTYCKCGSGCTCVSCSG